MKIIYLNLFGFLLLHTITCGPISSEEQLNVHNEVNFMAQNSEIPEPPNSSEIKRKEDTSKVVLLTEGKHEKHHHSINETANDLHVNHKISHEVVYKKEENHHATSLLNAGTPSKDASITHYSHKENSEEANLMKNNSSDENSAQSSRFAHLSSNNNQKVSDINTDKMHRKINEENLEASGNGVYNYEPKKFLSSKPRTTPENHDVTGEETNQNRIVSYRGLKDSDLLPDYHNNEFNYVNSVKNNALHGAEIFNSFENSHSMPLQKPSKIHEPKIPVYPCYNNWNLIPDQSNRQNQDYQKILPHGCNIHGPGSFEKYPSPGIDSDNSHIKNELESPAVGLEFICYPTNHYDGIGPPKYNYGSDYADNIKWQQPSNLRDDWYNNNQYDVPLNKYSSARTYDVNTMLK